MIIRFSAAIKESSHKSIFQANLVKLFLWKFLTFLDNISICQAVSSQPTNCLAGNFLFLVVAEAHWLMHETRNHQSGSCVWPDQLSVTKTKDRNFRISTKIFDLWLSLFTQFYPRDVDISCNDNFFWYVRTSTIRPASYGVTRCTEFTTIEKLPIKPWSIDLDRRKPKW